MFYVFLFTFMLACCVNHLNSLEARLVSEHLPRIIANPKGQSYNRATANSSAQDLVAEYFMTKGQVQVVNRSRSASTD